MTDSYQQKNINQPPPNTTLNASGGSIVEGNILAQSPATDNAAVLTSGSEQIDIIGVASVGGDDGSVIEMASSCPFNVLITGAIVRGDFVLSSAVAGIGESGVADPGVFAIAIESNGDTGVKLVACRSARAEVF